MQTANYLFVIIAITVVVTRLWLLVTHLGSPTIRGFKLHHYMYGIALIVLAFLISNLTLYGIGIGLFIDEFALVLVKKGNNFHWKEYNSLLGRVGALVCLGLCYVFMNYIVFVFEK